MNDNASTGQTLRGNFVMLRADQLRLLLPQEQVGAASYLEARPEPTDLPGFFLRSDVESGDGVVAMSARMWPLDHFPEDRFLITTLHAPQADVAFCWSEVKIFIDATLPAQRLPAPLDWEHGLVSEFVEIGGEVVFCCDASRLADRAFGQRN